MCCSHNHLLSPQCFHSNRIFLSPLPFDFVIKQHTLFVWLFWWGCWVWTQGVVHVKPVPYHYWVESPGKPPFFLLTSSSMDKSFRSFYPPSLSSMLLTQTQVCKYLSEAPPSGLWDTGSESKFLVHRIILCSRSLPSEGAFPSDVFTTVFRSHW